VRPDDTFVPVPTIDALLLEHTLRRVLTAVPSIFLVTTGRENVEQVVGDERAVRAEHPDPPARHYFGDSARGC
jgi:hypothetical protein